LAWIDPEIANDHVQASLIYALIANEKDPACQGVPGSAERCAIAEFRQS
jgi:hypothetical protein